jgi:DNA replication protein DnaC
MTPIERLQTALNGLGLKAVEARLENLLEQASKKEPSYADFLEELLSCEVDARRSRYLRARLQLAHLPCLRTSTSSTLGFSLPSMNGRFRNCVRCDSSTRPATSFFLDHLVLEKRISA